MNQSSLSRYAHKTAPYMSDQLTASLKTEKLRLVLSARRQVWPFLASYEQLPADVIAQPRLDLKSFVT